MIASPLSYSNGCRVSILTFDSPTGSFYRKPNFLSIVPLNSLPRPGEVEAPVPDVEHGEHEREEDSGEDVNLLGLELEVLEPHEKPVRVPYRKPKRRIFFNICHNIVSLAKFI